MEKSAAKPRLDPSGDFWLPSNRLYPPYVWSDVFGRVAPVEVDLGAGDGIYAEARARREPERDFVAVERLLGRATKIAKKASRGGLRNLRVLRLESSYFIKSLCSSGSLEAVTLRYPDPWPKRRHHGNRILNSAFAADLARAIRPSGLLKLTTDDVDYFAWACAEVDRCPEWAIDPQWTGIGEPSSEFEEQFRKEGRMVYRRAWARK